MTDEHDIGCRVPDGGLLHEGLDVVARELARAGFAALWRGRRLDPASLVPDAPDASNALAMLVARGRAEADGEGRVAGIHGLTLNPTRHRFEAGGRSHYTWCAFDAVGVPAALRIDAIASTDCPTCGATVEVHLHEGVPEDTAAALWLPSRRGENLRAEFCATADLYCSAAHLEDRVDTRTTPGTVTDLAGAARLGADTWADVRHLDLHLYR